MKHLKYGGSTAERTLECPGWHVQAKTNLPQIESAASEAANVGTALHKCMELVLLGEVSKPEELLGTVVEGVEITFDLIDTKILPARKAFADVCKQYEITDFEPECFVTLPERDDIGGWADVIAAGKDTTLVVDWKFGDGVMVSPEKSAQGLFYALCGANTESTRDLFEGREKIAIVIIQPTVRDDEQTCKVWDTTASHVSGFALSYLASVDEADAASVDDLEMLSTGDHCRWCPAMAVCPLKLGLGDAHKRFPVDSLAAEALSNALTVTYDLEQWIKSVQKLAHEQLERGDKIPGYKLVNKRAIRKWEDEEKVADVVKRSRKLKREDAYKSALLSPAQMEKLFTAKKLDFANLETYITKQSSGTTIAKMDDPRPVAVTMAALQALADKTAGQ